MVLWAEDSPGLQVPQDPWPPLLRFDLHQISRKLFLADFLQGPCADPSILIPGQLCFLLRMNKLALLPPQSLGSQAGRNLT